MIATHSATMQRGARAGQPVSSILRKRLARLFSGPVLWLGMPLLALLPLLLE